MEDMLRGVSIMAAPLSFTASIPPILCYLEPLWVILRENMERTLNIERFPKMGAPLNHPFLIGFSIINHPAIGVPLILGHLLMGIFPFCCHALPTMH